MDDSRVITAPAAVRAGRSCRDEFDGAVGDFEPELQSGGAAEAGEGVVAGKEAVRVVLGHQLPPLDLDAEIDPSGSSTRSTPRSGRLGVRLAAIPI